MFFYYFVVVVFRCWYKRLVPDYNFLKGLFEAALIGIHPSIRSACLMPCVYFGFSVPLKITESESMLPDASIYSIMLKMLPIISHTNTNNVYLWPVPIPVLSLHTFVRFLPKTNSKMEYDQSSSVVAGVRLHLKCLLGYTIIIVIIATLFLLLLFPNLFRNRSIKLTFAFKLVKCKLNKVCVCLHLF